MRTEIQTGVSDGEWIEVTNRQLPPARRRGDDPWAPIDGTEQVILGDLSILADGSPVEVAPAADGTKLASETPTADRGPCEVCAARSGPSRRRRTRPVGRDRDRIIGHRHAATSRPRRAVADRSEATRRSSDIHPRPESSRTTSDTTEDRATETASSEETSMSQAETPVGSSIVAVYQRPRRRPRSAVRQLHEAGFAMGDLSIIGRDFQMSEEPVGFVSAGDYAKAGAGTGAWFGGLFGLLVGAAFLIVPGVGPVVVAGPLAAAVLAGLEGAIAGTAPGQPGRCAGRLGHPQGPGPEVRDADQGRQVPRRRPRRPGGHRARPDPARPPDAGARGGLRADLAVMPPAGPGRRSRSAPRAMRRVDGLARRQWLESRVHAAPIACRGS